MNRSQLAIAAIRLLFTSLAVLALLAILTTIELGQALHKALNDYANSCIQSAPLNLLPVVDYPDRSGIIYSAKDTGNESILEQAETITESRLEPGNELTIRQLKAIAKDKKYPNIQSSPKLS
jgi:hypothetical protein